MIVPERSSDDKSTSIIIIIILVHILAHSFIGDDFLSKQLYWLLAPIYTHRDIFSESIVITLFRKIKHQSEFHLVLKLSKNGNYNPNLVWFTRKGADVHFRLVLNLSKNGNYNLNLVWLPEKKQMWIPNVKHSPASRVWCVMRFVSASKQVA